MLCLGSAVVQVDAFPVNLVGDDMLVNLVEDVFETAREVGGEVLKEGVKVSVVYIVYI